MLQLGPDDILYVDNDVVAVAKPAGIPSDTTPDPRRDTLLAAVARLFPADQGPWVVHRLDLETSGVVVLARSRRANAALSRAFASREVRKEYLAIVSPPMRDGARIEVVNHLRRPKSGPVMVVRSGGDRAETELQVLGSSQRASLVVAYPHTGRMHQIRVHLAGLGHPIVGDTLYGAAVTATRVMLHARRLSLPGWEEHAPIELMCPLPNDFVQVLTAMDLEGTTP